VTGPGLQAFSGAFLSSRTRHTVYPNCPVLHMTVEEWDRVMQINMRGVFLTCQAAAR